jgi:DNA-binding transcriptional ArsR family regulator
MPARDRHLAYLRVAGLLLARHNGQWMYYRINPALPGWAHAVLQYTLEGNAGADPFRNDRRILPRHQTAAGTADNNRIP